MKFCTKCKTLKDESEFHKDKSKKDGLKSQCKACDKKYSEEHKEAIKKYQYNYRKEHKEEKVEYDKNYREEHKEKIKESRHNYYEEHKEETKEYKHNYRKEHKEERIEYDKNYREEHKEKIKEYKHNYYKNPINKKRKNESHKERMLNDMEYNIKITIRNLFNSYMYTYSVIGKNKPANEYGIDFISIINHIGPCPGKRKNYHIDHIFPVSAFNHNDQIEIAACWAPENLRWLSAEENLKKNNKYNEEEFVKYLEEFKKNFK